MNGIGMVSRFLPSDGGERPIGFAALRARKQTAGATPPPELPPLAPDTRVIRPDVGPSASIEEQIAACERAVAENRQIDRDADDRLDRYKTHVLTSLPARRASLVEQADRFAARAEGQAKILRILDATVKRAWIPVVAAGVAFASSQSLLAGIGFGASVVAGFAGVAAQFYVDAVRRRMNMSAAETCSEISMLDIQAKNSHVELGEYQAAAEQARLARAHVIGELEPRLETLRMASSLNGTYRPDAGTVELGDNAVVIGGVRVPRRI